MDYQTSLQSMKNEIIMELRYENQSIVEYCTKLNIAQSLNIAKLNIAKRSIDAQNLTIIILSEELKTVKKGNI